MPCDCSYMEPTEREEKLRQTAKLLIYVKQKVGRPVRTLERKAAADLYGENGEQCVVELCGLLGALSPDERDRIVYGSPREKLCRQLADWWEEHQKADAKRQLKELLRDLKKRPDWPLIEKSLEL